jgi:copper resistance protein C
MRLKSSLGLALLATLFLAPAANSHDLLIDISPSEAEIVTEGNFEARLTFNNPLLVVGGETNAELATKLVGSENWENHEVIIEDRVLRATVNLSQAGNYELRWKVVSSDGHPISGESSFVLDIPAPDESATGNEPVLIAPGPASDQPEATGSLTGFYIGLAMVAVGAIFAPIGLMIRRRAKKS